MTGAGPHRNELRQRERSAGWAADATPWPRGGRDAQAWLLAGPRPVVRAAGESRGRWAGAGQKAERSEGKEEIFF
jgi:hypothetical protein